MGSRQVAMYFAWSRPDEENAHLGTLENRFTALFELRRRTADGSPAPLKKDAHFEEIC